MRPVETHPWGLTPADARALQETLAARVVLDNHAPARPAYIAGVDVSGAFSDGETLGAVVVMTWPGLEIAEVRVARKRPPMPYTPGLLSFRETPVLIDALAKLVHRPDILIADGHGIAHPRRFGIASHLGLLFDVPAIGLAKSRLVGRADVPGPRAGLPFAPHAPWGGDWRRAAHAGGRLPRLCLRGPQDRSGNGGALGACDGGEVPAARTHAPRTPCGLGQVGAGPFLT